MPPPQKKKIKKYSQTAQSAKKITEMKAIDFEFKAIDGWRLDNAIR